MSSIYEYIRFCAEVDLLKIEKKYTKTERVVSDQPVQTLADRSETILYVNFLMSLFACCKPYQM